ncbi:hypothetical protein [Miltoncostaea oceani]|uniref:hypothetical protein n=1 Tax=Miltoncostaea oceani TaxID=2843216 RepID=UPI001C3C8764|nr:hypothetical protein [Miltoncostaea oceani]
MPGGLLLVPPRELSPGPPNGDLAAGTAGWDVLGRDAPAPLPGGRGVRIAGNVTLVSPPLTVPAGAQVLRVALRAAGGEGLVLVAARPVAGGADIPLATLEPGPRRTSQPVGVAAVAGTQVRIVIDPVPALGTSVELHRVGPVTAPMPRWRVDRGTPEVAGARGRRTLRVVGEPLVVRAPVLRPPAGARALLVDVRGEGLVRAGAGARATALRASPAWRTLRVPLRPRTRAAVLRVEAVPGPGGLELRLLGVVLRTPGRSGGSGSR